MISFLRRGQSDDDITIFACNFTPVVYENHWVQVPFKGNYREVLNSDDEKYGMQGGCSNPKHIARNTA
jgi:1,4-alpha-glucan branching enzyme